MLRSATVRLIAVLLLLTAGAGVYACERSDTCASGSAAPAAGCDDPGGDACLCCCQHVVPAPVFALERGEVIARETPPEPAIRPVAASLDVDHPPKA